MANSGGEPAVILNQVIDGKDNFGYDASTEKFGDMLELGIVDPTKVTRSALQFAASVSGLMITTEVAIVEMPKEDSAMPPGGGMDMM